MKLRHALPALAPLAFAAAVAALAAPAAAKPAKAEAPSSDVAFGDSGQKSSYGLFLAGQAAMKDGRNDLALQYFDRATAVDIDLDGKTINRRAFIAAVFAGDVPRAARLAPGEELRLVEGRRRLAHQLDLAGSLLVGRPEALQQHWVAQPLDDLVAVAVAVLAGGEDAHLVAPQVQHGLQHQLAGMRIDPAPSEPSATGASPAATAAPLPPLLPPGV